MQTPADLEAAARADLATATDLDAVRAWQTKYFGDKGLVKAALAELGKLPKDQRAAYGQDVNRVKEALAAAHAEARALAASLTETIDVTLPGRPRSPGRLHPATQILDEITAIFADLGFRSYRTREVETDEFNFESLNMPPHHPARDMWDTFHTTTPGVLLRTHTSPGQIHAMRALGKEGTQPIRVILPGMCYRYEQVSARKEIQFNQVEGIAIGRNIRLTDLKGTIFEFLRRLYGDDVKVRFRSSYFPFTEPSMEVDVQAASIGKMGWLEVAGCGMIHPIVLQNGGYDPSVWSGFAFGFGPERLAMLKHNIQDIRYFWRNDLRFLEQF
jgi:phenylalanyl-tRNA synthetase alpha chain